MSGLPTLDAAIAAEPAVTGEPAIISEYAVSELANPPVSTGKKAVSALRIFRGSTLPILLFGDVSQAASV